MDDCEEGSCGTPDFRKLLVARDVVEAAAITARLEGEGIPVVRAGGQGALAFGEAPRDALTVELWVSADRFDEARAILAEGPIA